MADRLIQMDHDRRKMIVVRTITMDDGTICEKEVEMDLPEIPTTEGKLKKINIKDDGTMYETEEMVKFPLITKVGREEKKNKSSKHTVPQTQLRVWGIYFYSNFIC